MEPEISFTDCDTASMIKPHPGFAGLADTAAAKPELKVDRRSPEQEAVKDEEEEPQGQSGSWAEQVEKNEKAQKALTPKLIDSRLNRSGTASPVTASPVTASPVSEAKSRSITPVPSPQRPQKTSSTPSKSPKPNRSAEAQSSPRLKKSASSSDSLKPKQQEQCKADYYSLPPTPTRVLTSSPNLLQQAKSKRDTAQAQVKAQVDADSPIQKESASSLVLNIIGGDGTQEESNGYLLPDPPEQKKEVPVVSTYVDYDGSIYVQLREGELLATVYIVEDHFCCVGWEWRC